jgi:hypothetical protein
MQILAKDRYSGIAGRAPAAVNHASRRELAMLTQSDIDQDLFASGRSDFHRSQCCSMSIQTCWPTF